MKEAHLYAELPELPPAPPEPVEAAPRAEAFVEIDSSTDNDPFLVTNWEI